MAQPIKRVNDFVTVIVLIYENSKTLEITMLYVKYVLRRP